MHDMVIKYCEILYERYIGHESENYVNISGALSDSIRHELMLLVNAAQKTEQPDVLSILEKFDLAQKEAFMLMSDAFRRLRETEKFRNRIEEDNLIMQ